MKRRSFKISFTIGFISALIVAQGCGQEMKSTTSPLAQRYAVPASSAGPAPAGNSVSAMSPGLLGTYTYEWEEDFRCTNSSGLWYMQVPTQENDQYNETLTIEDRRVTRVVTFPESGCTINYVFQLRGIDQRQISLHQAQVSAFRAGSPDTAGFCARHNSIDSSSVLTYNYARFSSQELALIFPSSPGYCDADERPTLLYQRSY